MRNRGDNLIHDEQAYERAIKARIQANANRPMHSVEMIKTS
jgi:hypothetical protein